MRSTCETIGSDLAGKNGPFPIHQRQREVTHVHESKVADKNTPYWWEAAPVAPLPPQPLAKKLDVANRRRRLRRAGGRARASAQRGEGASTRNGGITSGSFRLDYATITRRFGEEKAMAIEAEGKIAREFLYDFISTEKLDCDLKLVGLFKGALGYEQYEKMARGAEALAKKLAVESYPVPHAEQRNCYHCRLPRVPAPADRGRSL
jgi:hypothetical protein